MTRTHLGTFNGFNNRPVAADNSGPPLAGLIAITLFIATIAAWLTSF